MNWWSQIAPVVGFVALIVSIVVAAWSAQQQGTIMTLRETATDLRNRLGDLQATVVEKDAVIAEREARLTAINSENQVLRGLVGGEVHWTALNDQLELHHSQAIKHWDITQRTLREMPAAIKDALTDSFTEAARTLKEGS